jgi:hypothetical protein
MQSATGYVNSTSWSYSEHQLLLLRLQVTRWPSCARRATPTFRRRSGTSCSAACRAYRSADAD